MATVSSFEMTPDQVHICPGKSTKLVIRVRGEDVAGLRVTPAAREGSPEPASEKLKFKKRKSSLLEAELTVKSRTQEEDYDIEVTCSSADGTVLGQATTQVLVRRDIHLVPSSLKLDERSLSGKILIENCSPVQPEVNLRLVCDNGQLVVSSEVKAKVSLPGNHSFDLKFRDDKVSLGSCRLEAVDADGNVLDSMPARQPVPPPFPVFLPVAAGAIIAVIVAIVLFWPTPTTLGFAVQAVGNGSIVTALEDGTTLQTNSSRTVEVEVGERVLLEAVPAEGWRFVGWSGGFGSSATITVEPGDGDSITASFVEPRIISVDCEMEPGPFIPGVSIAANRQVYLVRCNGEVSDFGEMPSWQWRSNAGEGSEAAFETEFTVSPVSGGAIEVALTVCDEGKTVCKEDGWSESVNGLPDLEVRSDENGMAVMNLSGDEKGCEVAFSVTNLAPWPSGAFQVEIGVYGEAFDGPSPVRTASLPIAGMKGGEQLQGTVIVPGAAFCEFNPDSRGYVEVDSESQIPELDESNNLRNWLILG